jgi:hypothetical protein
MVLDGFGFEEGPEDEVLFVERAVGGKEEAFGFGVPRIESFSFGRWVPEG